MQSLNYSNNGSFRVFGKEMRNMNHDNILNTQKSAHMIDLKNNVTNSLKFIENSFSN